MSAAQKKTTKKTVNKNTKKKKPTKKQIAQKKAFLRGEALAITVALLAVFLFFSNLGLFGAVGEFVGGFMKGIFGVMAYVFPLFLVYLVWFCTARRNDALFGWKIGALCAAFFSLSGLMQFFFGSKDEPLLREVYESASQGFFRKEGAGGFFGALLSDGIGSVLGRGGSFLILFALLLIALVALTEKSIIALTERGLDATYRAAKTGGARAKEHLSEEKVRMDMKREAVKLRRREEALQRTVRMEQENENRRAAALSNFDLKKNTETVIEPVPVQVMPESREPAPAESRVPFIEETVQETPAEIITPAAEKHPEEIRPMPEPDYEIDAVPFEETKEDKYKAYGRILAGGTFDLGTAKDMGFAVQKAVTPTVIHAVCEEEAAEEKTESETSVPREISENFRDFENAVTEEEINAEDVTPVNIPENPEEELPYMGDSFGEEEISFPEEPSGEEQISFIDEPSEQEEELPGDVSDQEEEADPEFIEREYRRKHIEERTPIHVSMDPAAEEPHGFGAENLVTPQKAAISTEDAQKALDERREAEKKAAKPMITRPYRFPPIGLLKNGKKPSTDMSLETEENSRTLEKVLGSFGVGVKVTNVVVGPRVTRYEMTPDIGVKVSRITALQSDIKMALAARELRIEAPIPGKSAVGIEVPNKESAMVTFRDIMETEPFKTAKSKLTWGVGLDIQGTPIVADIAKMPHLLVSGTTGSGKSVGINSIIMSVIYKQKPEDVRMILVDPKVVELSVYDGIPHLLAPVVTKPEQAINVLRQACAEMNQRYRLFKESNTRNIKGYNEKVQEVIDKLPPDAEKPEKMPYILIIIDELAELMMHSKKDVEDSIASLTQLARAAGIHLVVATQRPSVDVVTGLIKSNIPSRVAMRLPSLIDSRTILDTGGAESLLGNGDMLYKTGDMSNPLRIQGCYLSDEEVSEVVEWLKKNNHASYNDDWETAMNVTAPQKGDAGGAGFDSAPAAQDDDNDPYFFDAGDLITDKKKASIGMLQRKFKIGFNRAARIMEQLCEAGVVSEGEGTKERQILMENSEFREIFGNG